MHQLPKALCESQCSDGSIQYNLGDGSDFQAMHGVPKDTPPLLWKPSTPQPSDCMNAIVFSERAEGPWIMLAMLFGSPKRSHTDCSLLWVVTFEKGYWMGSNE